MTPNVKVQSLPSGFDGTTSNGIMPLRVSTTHERVLYQVHPGESVFIASHTISIVPEQYREVPTSPPGHDNFRDHVSQNASQLQASRRLLATPTHNRVRSMLSSPVEINNDSKQTATLSPRSNDDGHTWSRDGTKNNLLTAIRDVSRKRKVDTLHEEPCHSKNTCGIDRRLTWWIIADTLMGSLTYR